VTGLIILLAVVCQLFNVAGQLLLKLAMEPADPNTPRTRRVVTFVVAVACLAGWFFLWVGLLADNPLTQVFPFAGLNPALVAVAAWLFLREHLAPRAWAGVVLITAGVVIVSM
jgi:undecaprenyl phosphate-alpha-L-ara4N flippase subunit ArnE